MCSSDLSQGVSLIGVDGGDAGNWRGVIDAHLVPLDTAQLPQGRLG